MKISIFGESHAPEIGVVIEGVPKGTEIDQSELQRFLDRRAPGNGQGGMSTPRKEPDRVEFTSGVTSHQSPSFVHESSRIPTNPIRANSCQFVDKNHQPPTTRHQPLATIHQTDGSPIRAVIRNTNTRPQDYANVRTVPRPGHADYASWLQCGKIPTGGGKWSGRMTAPLCIAGGIALQMLARRGVAISSTVRRGGGDAPVPDGDSVGGIVEVVATGVPAGLGDVGTAGLESKLAAAFFGIPAVKGVEFGDGFALADMNGSAANDAFVIEGTRNEGNAADADKWARRALNAADADKWARRALNAASRLNGPAGLKPPSPQSPNPSTQSPDPSTLKVTLRTNHCGGILGGVSVGTPIVARLAFKPTPSISLEQDSVDLATMTPAKIAVKGRHDRCVAFRGAVAAEAAMAIVLETEIFG